MERKEKRIACAGVSIRYGVRVRAREERGGNEGDKKGKTVNL